MKQFWKDLLEGKYAIGYTLNALANMVPREIRWLNKVPILRQFFQLGQFFWFMVKIIFFAMIISWFKPQYNHGGAKIALFIITLGVVFFAVWLMNRGFKTNKVN